MNRNRQGHYYHFMDILIAAKVIDRYTGPSVTPFSPAPWERLGIEATALRSWADGKTKEKHMYW